MKKIISLIIVFAVCFQLVAVTLAAESKVDPEATEAILTINENLMAQSFRQDKKNGVRGSVGESDYSQIEVSLNTDAKSVAISGPFDVILTGCVEDISYNNIEGYIGVYEGSLDDGTHIIVDAVYTAEEVFVAITLGFLGTEDFAVMFYGDLTNRLKLISNMHAAEVCANQETSDDNLVADVAPETVAVPYVQAETIFQGTSSVYSDVSARYLFGVTSVYHADELRNQGVMPIYAKVNTQCDVVEEYLINEEDFSGTLTVYPDTFNISICGNDNNLHAINNTYTPESNSTSATISIPVYGGSVIGLQFISHDILMTSTNVTVSKYTTTSQHPNNKVSWEIYKRFGWGSSETDGYPSSEAGMVVSADYTYSGNVSSSFDVYMNTKSSIRYEYTQYILGNSITLHLSTNEMSATTLLSIVP